MNFLKRPRIELTPAQERAAADIANRITRKQQAWSDWLTRQSERLPSRTKLILLILFVLAGMGLSAWQFKSVSAESNNTKLLSSERFPRTHPPTRVNPEARVSEKEHAHMLQFRRYMDSLATTPSGKIKRDSLLVARAGLMDSIRKVEELYLQQQGK